MKKLIIAVSFALLSTSAHAERVTRTEIVQSTASMFDAYRYSGPSGMLAIENDCWDHMEVGFDTNEAVAIRCSIASLAGAFIEAFFARSGRRAAAPTYSGDGVRERMLSRMIDIGMHDDEAEAIIKNAVSHQDDIVYGLFSAGMK